MVNSVRDSKMIFDKSYNEVDPIGSALYTPPSPWHSVETLLKGKRKWFYSHDILKTMA